MTLSIRPECPADYEAIHWVNSHAFGQDDEAVLVDALRADGHARLSLVAEVDGAVVGHVLFSELPILTDRGIVPTLALAPVAVRPDKQKRGIGSALIRAGLAAARADGHRIVVVLGHAEYYPRFGFSAKLAEALSSPFSGRDSWMALELVPGALEGVVGTAQYAPPFGIEQPVRRPLRIRILGGTYAVCKLAATAAMPPWAKDGALVSVTRTTEELSIVCRAEDVPEGVACERGWRCLRVAGTMPFSLVGVVASLTTPLANAGVGVFVLSTFDTDYLLVKAEDLEKALSALRGADGEPLKIAHPITVDLDGAAGVSSSERG
jgi:putative acetyltransferase